MPLVYRQEDGNNNMQSQHSDASVMKLEKTGRDRDDHDDINSHKSSSQYIVVDFLNAETIASYSPDNSNVDRQANDVETSDTEVGGDADAGLRIKVLYLEEENASLRDEVLQYEKLITSLQRQLVSLQRALKQEIEKTKQLQNESDEQKELLRIYEEKIKLNNVSLRQHEKTATNLEKKIASLEAEKEEMLNISAKLEKVSKENNEHKKQISQYMGEYEKKCVENEILHHTIANLENIKTSLETSFESTVNCLRNNVQLLRKENVELKAQWDINYESTIQTPPYNRGIPGAHSTPVSKALSSEILERSLYDELKDEGASLNCCKDDSKIHELDEKCQSLQIGIDETEELLDNVVQRFTSPDIEVNYDAELQKNVDSINTKAPEIVKLQRKVSLISSLLSKQLSMNVSNKTSKPIDRQLETVNKTLDITNTDNLNGNVNEPFHEDGSISSLEYCTVNSWHESLHEEEKGCNSNLKQTAVAQFLFEQVEQCTVFQRYDEYYIANSNMKETLHNSKNSSTNSESLTQETHSDGDSDIINSSVPLENKTNSSKLTSCNLSKEKVALSQVCDVGTGDEDVPKSIDSQEAEKLNKESGYQGSLENPTMTSAANSFSPNNIPKRKLSVYHSSFDINSLQIQKDADGQNDRRLSMSTGNLPEGSREYVWRDYRTVNESDSSNCSSPGKQIQCHSEKNSDTKVTQKSFYRTPLILTPSKLSFFKENEQKNTEENGTVKSTTVQVQNLISDSSSDKIDDSSQSSSPKSKNVTYRKCYGHSLSLCDISPNRMKFFKRASESNTSSAGCMQYRTEDTLRRRKPQSEESTSESDMSFGEELFCTSDSAYKTTNEVKDSDSSKISSFDSLSSAELNSNSKEQTQISSSILSTSTSPSITDIPKIKIVSDPPLARNARTDSEKVRAEPTVERVMSNGKDSECESVTCAVTTGQIAPLRENQVVGGRDHGIQEDDKHMKVPIIKRSASDSDVGKEQFMKNLREKATDRPFARENQHIQESPKPFPSLTDVRLQVSGIGSLSDVESEISEIVPEVELERKYTALSIGLTADRMTLSRRMALSLRQRNQAEENLSAEIQKMEQDIQDLTPLCVDKESIERVERARHQLQMITQCAHRVSCTAETLGAIHQERRVSRAVLLADRYLQVLRTRCEKLVTELTETKRILIENNIMIEENSSELGDDVPRIRYRAVNNNNRTMMARRRASVATMSRPLTSSQENVKECQKQRNSISGRVSLRRPSLTYENQKMEIEKLDRTDSTSSIGELREVTEQVRSRHNSREENCNSLQRQSSNSTFTNYSNTENEGTLNSRDTNAVSELEVVEEICTNTESIQRTSTNVVTTWSVRQKMSWGQILWGCLLGFLFGFYINQVVSSSTCRGTPCKWWSIQELLSPYIEVQNTAARPI